MEQDTFYSEFPRNLTIIIADAPRFHGIRQRAQQLALGFASKLKPLNGTVWYLDEPGNIVTVFLSPEKPLSNLWAWIRAPKIDPESGIIHYVPPAGLPFGYHVRAINQWNHLCYRLALGWRYQRNPG